MKPRETLPRRTLVQFEISPRSIAYVTVAVAAIWLLIKLFPILMVLVVALLLVGTLNPLVERLEARGVRRGWSIAIVFSTAVLVGFIALALTVPALFDQAMQLIDKEPAIRADIAERLASTRFGKSLGVSLRSVRYDVIAKNAAASLLLYSTRVVEVVAYSASAVFLALYIMIDRDRLRGGLFALVPRSHHLRLARVLLNLQTIVGGYIRGQLITSGLMTVFTFVLLTACGIEAALALAVFAGLADVLPYIGVVLSVGPVVLAAIARGPVIVAVVLVLMLAYEQLESRMLVPRIYGRALRLPSSVVMFSLLAGGTLMGILGALLALPVAATIRMLIDELRVELPGEQLPRDTQRKDDARAEDEYQRRAEGVPAKQASAIAVQISDERRHQESDTAGERDEPQ